MRTLAALIALGAGWLAAAPCVHAQAWEVSTFAGAPALRPEATFVAPDGAVYVTEPSRVLRVVDGVATVVFGSTPERSGAATTLTARYTALSRAVLGPDGTLFVVDRGARTVRTLRDGQASTLPGSHDLDVLDIAVGADGSVYLLTSTPAIGVVRAGVFEPLVPDMTPGLRDGPVARARFDRPTALALGRQGALYVLDAGNCRLRIIHRNRVRSVGDSRLTCPYSVGTSLAVAANGDAYITTPDIRQLFRIRGRRILAHTGTPREDELGPTREATSLRRPVHVSVGPDGALYVSEDGGVRVLRGDAVEWLIPAEGMSDGPLESARFRGPSSVAFGPDETLYVSDARNGRIRAISGGVVRTLAGTRWGTFAVERPALEAGIGEPAGLFIARGGALTFGDTSNAIVNVVEHGLVRTLAGTRGLGETDGPAARATFRQPSALAVGPDGAVYLVDRMAHRIRVIRGDRVETLAGASAGYADGSLAEARFSYPTAIAVGGDGALYVADSGNTVVRVIRAGQVSTLGRYDGPSGGGVGMALAPDGTIFLAIGPTHRVGMLRNGQYTVIAGTGEQGLRDGPGSEARFFTPSGIALARDGALYVADSLNHRIRVLRPPR